MEISKETLEWIKERAAANEDIDANELLVAVSADSTAGLRQRLARIEGLAWSATYRALREEGVAEVRAMAYADFVRNALTDRIAAALTGARSSEDWRSGYDDWKLPGPGAPGSREWYERQIERVDARLAIRASTAGLDGDTGPKGEPRRYTAYVDGRMCHNCGLEPYLHLCPADAVKD